MPVFHVHYRYFSYGFQYPLTARTVRLKHRLPRPPKPLVRSPCPLRKCTGFRLLAQTRTPQKSRHSRGGCVATFHVARVPCLSTSTIVSGRYSGITSDPGRGRGACSVRRAVVGRFHPFKVGAALFSFLYLLVPVNNNLRAQYETGRFRRSSPPAHLPTCTSTSSAAGSLLYYSHLYLEHSRAIWVESCRIRWGCCGG